MSTLWVTEYLEGSTGDLPCPGEPAITTQVVTYTTSVATANALSGACGLVRVIASAACHIKVAETPVATTSDMKLAASDPYYFVPRGGVLKVAAIDAV